MAVPESNSDSQKPRKARVIAHLRAFKSVEEFVASREDGYVQLSNEQPLGRLECFTLSLSGRGAPGDELCLPREVVSPAIYWYRLSDVLINFPLHVMWTRDGQRLSDLSIYGNDLPTHLVKQKEIAVRGEYCVATNNNFANYAHWMTECLPGLYAAHRLNIPGDSIFVPPLNLPFHRPSSHTLGVDIQQSPTISVANLRVQTLHFLSYADHSRPRHVTWPADLAEIASRLRRWSKRAGGAHHYDRIYISRRSASRRRCENEVAFEDEITKLGFVIVTLENLPLEQQVYLFACASAVVAFHGAALTNIMFCRPDALIIEIQPASARSSHFIRISHQFGLRYSVFRQPGDWGESPHASWHLDIQSALEFVRATMDKADLASAATML